MADMEECHPDLLSREDSLPSCGLCSPQTASSCQPLQGGPQLLRAQGHAFLGSPYLVAKLKWGS